MRIGDSFWKGRNPSFGLPFVRIRAPDLGVSVGAHDGYDDVRVVGNGDLCDLSAVHPDDRFGKWKYGVFAGAMNSYLFVSVTWKKACYSRSRYHRYGSISNRRSVGTFGREEYQSSQP